MSKDAEIIEIYGDSTDAKYGLVEIDKTAKFSDLRGKLGKQESISQIIRCDNSLWHNKGGGSYTSEQKSGDSMGNQSY
eukprot:CAMPEP_0184658450 /NCGR_PEP_ID=MMETSP0308-20130426/25436_1 /TAXON_ID=38269 /ORGANISM="Gloeochaete witrockiana, Strain SAG 46.84" /LENGTH=77 /DNA_ID=CAMNT_0027097433 /DNA_START=41 /DNA_END=274 /DNA_ORIENTATION=-